MNRNNVRTSDEKHRLAALPRCTAVAFVLLAAVLHAGCTTFRAAPSERASYHYTNPAKVLSAAGHVTILELENQSAYPQMSTDMTDAVYQALQKKHLFGLSVIRADEPAAKNLQVHPQAPYTLEQLLATRKATGSNAILVGTITNYQPYPHMSIGLRLKLVDLTDGQLLWAVEQVWDTTDKDTQLRIKHYYDSQLRAGLAPLKQELVSVSPINFMKFVAFEVSETLQSK